MLRLHIMRDLNLAQHGFRIFRPKYASHIISNGDAFTFKNGTQGDAHFFQVQGLSDEDLREWSNFWEKIESAGAILASGTANLGYTQARFKDQLHAARLGDLADSVFEESLFDFARTRVRHPSLLSAILTMSGSHPFSASSLFELIYYCTAESFGEPAAWGYVEGGMGSLADALVAEAMRLGVTLVPGTAVDLLESRERVNIVTSDGREQEFDTVVLATDPVTAYKFLLRRHAHDLPLSLHSAIESNEATSTYGVLHLKTRVLPEFPILSEIGRVGSERYSGAFDFSLTAEELEERFTQSKRGIPLVLPNLACNVFSSVDATVTKGNGHVLTVIIQSVDSTLTTPQAREQLYRDCIHSLSRWSPDLPSLIDDYRLITPHDLALDYGLRSGCCFHLRSSTEHALDSRPFAEVAGYKTPVRSVYLTGAGSYPGGCVSGMPGYLCARQIIAEASAS
jgi:phytoene dehydrogenase-like protein